MPSHLTRPKDQLTAAEKVTRALRLQIMTGTLLPGAQIRQEQLAEQHGVSRMPVREALRQLEAEGLIAVYPNWGARVAMLDAGAAQEIYDIRLLLEVDALRRAWTTLTPAILDHAEQLLDQMDREEASVTWRNLDEKFHRLLYAPSQRARLLDLINTLRHQVTHFFFLVNSPNNYRTAWQQEHRQILAACQAGDLAAAVQALETHLQTSARVIVSTLQQRQAHDVDEL